MEDSPNSASCIEDPSVGVLGPWECGAWACTNASQCWSGLHGAAGEVPLRHRATCMVNTGVLPSIGESPAMLCACYRGFYGAMCERETPELLTFRAVRWALLAVELLLLGYGVLTLWQAFRERLLRARPLWLAMVASLLALISHALWSAIVIAGSVGALSPSQQRSVFAAFSVALPATGVLMYCETLATSLVWVTVLGMRRESDGAWCGWAEAGFILTFLLTLPIAALFFAGFHAAAFVACLPLLCITSVTFGVVVLRVKTVYATVRWAEDATSVVVSAEPAPASRPASTPAAGTGVDSSSNSSSSNPLFAGARGEVKWRRSSTPQQHSATSTHSSSLSSMRVFCKWFPAVWHCSLHAKGRDFAPGENSGESVHAAAQRQRPLQDSSVAAAGSSGSSLGRAIGLGQRRRNNKASLLVQSLQQISVAATAMSLALLFLLVTGAVYYSYWSSPRLGGEPTAMLFFLLISVGQDMMNASVVVYVRSAFLTMLRLRAERATVVLDLNLATAFSRSLPPPPPGVDDDSDDMHTERNEDAHLRNKMTREAPERG
jgi:hypothetical protein